MKNIKEFEVNKIARQDAVTLDKAQVRVLRELIQLCQDLAVSKEEGCSIGEAIIAFNQIDKCLLKLAETCLPSELEPR